MILKVCAMGIITAMSAMIVKNERQDISILISVIGGIAIVLSLFDYFTDIFDFIKTLTDSTGLELSFVTYLLKMVGVGYLTEFACDTVTETGSPSLANKISLAGKVIIICLTIPIIKELIEIVVLLVSSS